LHQIVGLSCTVTLQISKRKL